MTPRPRLIRSPRIRLAIVLFALNLVIGLPGVAIAGAASPWIGVANAAILAGLCYAASWILLGISSVLGGPVLMRQLKLKLARALGRKP